jgi:transcriptional regulator with XRE-family HTH domain
MDARDRIRARLDSLGISVRGASIAAGMGETTLRNYLKGMTKSLTVDSLEKLADVLEIAPTSLLYGDSAEVVNIWDRIPEDRRPLARDVLESFAKKAGEQ